MISAPLPPDEADRLALLHRLGLLDSAPDPVLDGLVRCAAQLTGCPVALVSLLDADRQWFKARYGLEAEGTPREVAFCAHALASDALMEVPDAQADERFRDNPLVTGELGLRFYAGIPVQAQGRRLGTLCVIDRQPRVLDAAARALLVDLGRAVSHWLQGRVEQQALEASRERLADFAAAGSDWLWECDGQQNYTWVSEGFASASGIDPASLVGIAVPDAELLDDEGQPLLPRATVHSRMAQGRPFVRALVRRAYPSGERVVSISARPQRDGAGRIVGWRGVARDVSALVAARQLARARSELLARLAEQLPGFVYQFEQRPDGSSRFPYASRHSLEIYELAPEVLERDAGPALQRVHPEDLDRVAQSIARSAQSLQPWHCEYRVRLPQRGERWLEGAAMPVRLEDGTVLWHGFITDVTERRQQTLQVLAAEQRRLAAEQASRDKSRFLSRVSHELRTPLNAVLGFSQLALAEGGTAGAPLPPGRREQVAQVLRAGRELLALVDDLLELGQGATARTALQLQPLPLRAVLGAALAAQGAAARRAHVGLLPLPAAAEAPGLSVQADPVALQQVLAHLLSNAIKFNQAGGCAGVALRVRDGRVRLTVHDDGPGLDPGRRRALFQPFNRLGAEDSGVPGSGLGLLLARRLVLALGSRLGVASAPGRGSRFFFTLPLVAPPADEVIPAAATVADPPLLLYIEDDPVNTLLVQELVAARTPWRLLTAADGPSGVAMARAHRPALVLTDMNLPGLGGLQVVAALRADAATRGTVCIALSADAMPEQIERALAAGFDDYLTKPIDLAQMVERLRGWLQQRGALPADGV